MQEGIHPVILSMKFFYLLSLPRMPQVYTFFATVRSTVACLPCSAIWPSSRAA